MPSLIEDNPDVSMADSFAGLSQKQITARERLRLRALIGGVSVKMLSDLTPAELIDVLKDAHSHPGAYAPDHNVRRDLTVPLDERRIPGIARHYLAHLRSEPVSADTTQSSPPSSDLRTSRRPASVDEQLKRAGFNGLPVPHERKNMGRPKPRPKQPPGPGSRVQQQQRQRPDAE